MKMENYKQHIKSSLVKVWQNKATEGKEIFVQTDKAGIALFFQDNEQVKSETESKAHAELFAESLNTLSVSGFTPAELLEQRDELLEAAEIVYEALSRTQNSRNFAAPLLRKAIKNCKQ